MPAKKTSSSKKQTGKTIAKKITAIKVPTKKADQEKDIPKKKIAEKDDSKKVVIKTKLTTIISSKIISINTPGELPADTDCMCMQKKPNGNFYNFTLQQGRWVQSSAIPFPTKEACEEACC
jgi:hypothetical protein